MAKIEFKKEMKKNNTGWTQNGIKHMNEGNSKRFFDNIRKFNGSMNLNNIGVLRHKGKTQENDCHKAALFHRVFFSMAHPLLVNYLTTLFLKKTKVKVEGKLAHIVGNYYKEEAKNDLNMRITMNELEQAIKKMNANNKGVKPYGLYPRLLKKFKFNTIGICLHLITVHSSWGFGHLIKP